MKTMDQRSYRQSLIVLDQPKNWKHRVFWRPKRNPTWRKKSLIQLSIEISISHLNIRRSNIEEGHGLQRKAGEAILLYLVTRVFRNSHPNMLDEVIHSCPMFEYKMAKTWNQKPVINHLFPEIKINSWRLDKLRRMRRLIGIVVAEVSVCKLRRSIWHDYDNGQDRII